jgi:GxxExxY protein
VHKERKRNNVEQDLQRQEKVNELSKLIFGAAIELHRYLGPGLSGSAYQTCLCHQLSALHVPFHSQVSLPVVYKGLALDAGYKLDVVVDGLVVVELKAIENLAPIHQAQLLTYLRLSGLWLGLLIKFNAKVLKDGIKRMVNG